MDSSSTVCTLSPTQFTAFELQQFKRDGFLVVRNMVNEGYCDQVTALSKDHLKRIVDPVEYETDLHYPGAPESSNAFGGKTIRRLLNAQARHPLIAQWVNDPSLQQHLLQLLGNRRMMSLAHHNCIMTKHPHFSSDTNWHQDIRYWSFQRPELISVWLALGKEYAQNGGLKVIPGSHLLEIPAQQFGPEQFLNTDHKTNIDMINRSIDVELNKGDVLFFHCRTLHAAGRNKTSSIKFSAVFSFHAADNQPLKDTRSSSLPELVFSG